MYSYAINYDFAYVLIENIDIEWEVKNKPIKLTAIVNV